MDGDANIGKLDVRPLRVCAPLADKRQENKKSALEALSR